MRLQAAFLWVLRKLSPGGGRGAKFVTGLAPAEGEMRLQAAILWVLRKLSPGGGLGGRVKRLRTLRLAAGGVRCG
jgi:hypothetical protein